MYLIAYNISKSYIILSRLKSYYILFTLYTNNVDCRLLSFSQGTLFAYGQTSSGKTFTMTGTSQSPGIILYALQDVFDYIADSKNQEFLLRVSFLEIYNDKLTDLLNPGQANLKIRENTNREISVENLTEEVVTSIDEVIRFMNIGQKNRRIGATNMNERSSRSHTIFRMVIY